MKDPADHVLIEAMLDGLKYGLVFLVDNETSEDVERLARKTERLALEALVSQFGEEAARKFFRTSENPWILRTTFGGWLFFYPIEVLTPDMSMGEVGQPEFVYWPDAEGTYARVPWSQWVLIRRNGSVWRPPNNSTGSKTIWDRLRDP